MKKDVYTYEKQIDGLGGHFGKVAISMSKYSDCLFVFVNQTGTIGSIIEGQVSESTAELAEDFQYDSQQPTKEHFLYEIKGLFGSSQIEFYELLLRRVMGTIWQEMKVEAKFRVILNISLPVLHPSFDQQQYYSRLIEECQQGLMSVL